MKRSFPLLEDTKEDFQAQPLLTKILEVIDLTEDHEDTKPVSKKSVCKAKKHQSKIKLVKTKETLWSIAVPEEEEEEVLEFINPTF